MFFTRLGKIVAILALTLGAIRIGTAVLILFSDDPVGAAPHYLGSRSTGDAIDQGLYTVAFGILIGMLAEISKALATILSLWKRHASDEDKV